MRVCRLGIRNFRGIREAEILLPVHVALIGDNNTGKTTILEALDLVLGPDRLNRRPPIDEHDFFRGRYLPESPPETDDPQNEEDSDVDAVEANPEGEAPEPAIESAAPKIQIDAVVTDLNDEQKAHFGAAIEFWCNDNSALYEEPNPEGVDTDTITEAIRVSFIGEYDPADDDFIGSTVFTRSLVESETPEYFRKTDKQRCGFLYLRSVRTGSRALSLERGSLLDIILRVKELRPQMWEATLQHISDYEVASDPALGLSGILKSIEDALKTLVPKEWGIRPHLKVSNLTREHLRKVITAFIATGDGEHAAPFYRQGTGTLNMLVLAMLSQIAKDKQNVIFAMEEPETAIPPYAQKRIVHEVRKLSAQAMFTSHSPYILEEFEPDETLVFRRDEEGVLTSSIVDLPNSVKQKRYRQDFRTRFCEGLLARRVLVCEGSTEAQSFSTTCRRLEELAPEDYSSTEALGVCVIDAGGEKQIADLAGMYRSLGKQAYGLCDKQDAESEAAINGAVDELYMHTEKGIEDLVLKQTTEDALQRFSDGFDWPSHLAAEYPNPHDDIHAAMAALFKWGKGDWVLADYLVSCSEDEIPEWLRETAKRLKTECEPGPEPDAQEPESGDEDEAN